MKRIRKMTENRWPIALASIALAAAACGGADDGVTEDQTEPATGTTTEATQPAMTETETTQATETGTEAAAGEGETSFTASLSPLNDSGTSGTAQVNTSADGQVTVTLTTDSASPNAPHAQHIHIGGENQCPTPDAAGDDDLISTPEGQPAYGEIAISLTTEGDVSPTSALAVDRFPVAGEDGQVTYERTFQLPEGTTVEDLMNGVIVQHGLADSPLGSDPAAYDGPDSPLKEGVPQEATLPVACGELSEGNATS